VRDACHISLSSLYTLSGEPALGLTLLGAELPELEFCFSKIQPIPRTKRAF